MPMMLRTVETEVLRPPKDDLLAAIAQAVPRLREKSVVVIASKVVSIWQGRCVPKSSISKDELVAREADWYLTRKLVPGAWCMHTIKNNIFIPSAGVDESNAGEYYILWPENPKKTAKDLWGSLRKRYRVKNLGIIIADSHTIPLRRGVLGISLAHYGFAPLRDYRGSKDLFGRELSMTQTNIADGLAAAAVVLIGEGAEATPVCIIEDMPWMRFVEKPMVSRQPFSSFEIKTEEDLYYPLLSSVPWKKGNGRSTS